VHLLIACLVGTSAFGETSHADLRLASSRRFLPADFDTNPYDRQVAEQICQLQSPSSDVRAGAAEALGYLRAYTAANDLVKVLRDESAQVRREAAMALAWCGGRKQVPELLSALEDKDWVVRQGTWVALTNLTGMQWPFDALGEPDVRKRQAQAWCSWWRKASKEALPSDVLALVDSQEDNARLRGLRALGSLGGKGATEVIRNAICEYRDKRYRSLSDIEKNVVQCGLRSIGRLGEREGLDVLLGFLETVSWARYAADALGDLGNGRAAPALIEAYPRFSRNLQNRERNPKLCPHDDRFSGDNTQDRMHETPYNIALALSRLGLGDPNHIAGLRKISPYLLANLPTSWDSGVFYEIEAAQLITAYLLEKAQIRQTVCDIGFDGAERLDRDNQPRITGQEQTPEETVTKLALRMYEDVPDVATWFPAICRREHVARLIALLQHEDGWIRINVAKALMFIGDKRGIQPLARLLSRSKPEALWGYSGVLEHAEYNDPAPRWREPFIRALGRLGAAEYDKLLIEILQDPRNVVDMQHAAALSLDELGTPNAVAALKLAEAEHSFHSVRLAAREALRRRAMLPPETKVTKKKSVPNGPSVSTSELTEASGRPQAIVFIKGANRVRSDFNGQAGVDPWRQTYTITNSGPTFRVGRNLYILRPAEPRGNVTPLTNFKNGFVADCELSWDGKKVIFSRRLNNEARNYREVPYQEARLKNRGEPLLGGPDDPWWHIWQVNADGTGLRQITHGPYHDVNPAYLPDGRIVFSSSRLGLRDEYHGYPCLGLTVMNADGSNIHPIGFNFGSDRDPAVLDDGRIVFSRVDLFYSRLKTEVAIHTVFPDGTRNESLYGPERRPFWIQVHKKNAAWTQRDAYADNQDNRNRVLRLSQPQSFGNGRVLFASSGGLGIAGTGRYQERLIPHQRKMAVTSPFPLPDGTILCAATVKQFKVKDRVITAGTREFERLEKGPELFRSAINIDLGLYFMNAGTGKMTLLYNDPQTAEFEPRPVMARRRPSVLAENPNTSSRSYTARLFCNSANTSRHGRVTSRGRLIRVIEGRPVVSRHETQQNLPTNRWKNHGGTHARVLGTIPLAPDGSFFVEVPADRLLQLQVLDSDRKVLGNQLFWMYARPGETRSCIGCHENRDRTFLPDHFAAAAKLPPVKMLPAGYEFSYRAKTWLKGALPDEAEQRQRTVRAVNLIGRY
jgi:HEAT repeat protein